MVHVACSQPKDWGYAAELWTRQALAQHVRREARAAGHPSLAQASKATVHRILAAQPLPPHKVTYYWQRRDPAFESQMREVLLVYQEVALHNQSGAPGISPLNVITISVDEKPGVQAISHTAPDLPPVPGKHPTVARDHEDKRLGTCSILAALDLHTGHVTGRVERRHRSREFIALLRDLDDYYPKDGTLRLVLDNHAAHLSQETQDSLATQPNRFKYVLTPSHGSWLNLRRRFRQNGAYVLATHSCPLVGGAPRAYPERHRGDQRRSSSASVEEIWRPHKPHPMNGYISMQRYTSPTCEPGRHPFRSGRVRPGQLLILNRSRQRAPNLRRCLANY